MKKLILSVFVVMVLMVPLFASAVEPVVITTIPSQALRNPNVKPIFCLLPPCDLQLFKPEVPANKD